MKKYEYPKLEVVELKVNDIITTSIGTETSVQDETDGSWQIGLGL